MKDSDITRGSRVLGFLRRKNSSDYGLFSKDSVLAAVVLLLVAGAFTLALIDQDCRAAFADLAKVGIGCYMGTKIPK